MAGEKSEGRDAQFVYISSDSVPWEIARDGGRAVCESHPSCKCTGRMGHPELWLVDRKDRKDGPLVCKPRHYPKWGLHNS
jgi:hypothetical protein